MIVSLAGKVYLRALQRRIKPLEDRRKKEKKAGIEKVFLPS